MCSDVSVDDIVLCTCQKTNNSDLDGSRDEVVCESTGKSVPLRSPGYICHKSGRRKRNADTIYDDNFISDKELYSVAIEGPGRQLPLIFDWQPGRKINESYAQFLCNDIIHSWPSYQSCKDDVDIDRIVTECLTDVYVSMKTFRFIHSFVLHGQNLSQSLSDLIAHFTKPFQYNYTLYNWSY